ncbi:MAG: carbonic anhydrase [Rhabdochlamydiaceae bacterium]|nr:carbonic anhydrase [Rhabdochlamydiaceae bacterium]
MKYTSFLCMTAGITLFSMTAFSAESSLKPTPDQALKMLMDGNNRFVKEEFIHKNLAQESADLKEGQEPFAVIIGCSDSRVPPEIIFDQGPGDLFVVRDAGNVIGPIEMDSIQFAVQKLHTPIVVVLGHENCGAVHATLLGQANVPELSNIFPLIEKAIKECKETKGDLLKNAIQCNVKEGTRNLKAQPNIAQLIKQNKLKVIGAYFNFDDGKVSIIE